MNEKIIRLAESLVGPVLDFIGTRTKPTSLTTYDIVDKQTKQIIGEGCEIAGDGLSGMDTYSKPSSLRSRIFGK